MNRIEELRKAAGLSQAKLAEKLNVHQTAVSQWEKGRTYPDMAITIQLADLFGVSIDCLLGHNINKQLAQVPKEKADLKMSLHAIGYIDVLGAKEKMQKNADEELKKFNSIIEDVQKYIKNRNTDNAFGANIKYKIFSDNIVVAIEIDENQKYFNIAQIMIFLARFQSIALCEYNIIMRGCINVGMLYIDEELVFGDGLIEAYEIENSIALYPRIIIEQTTAEYLLQHSKENPENSLYTITKMVCIDFDGLFYLNFLQPLVNYKHTDKYPEFTKMFRNLSELMGVIVSADTSLRKVRKLQKLDWLCSYFILFCNQNNIKIDFPKNVKNFEEKLQYNHLEKSSISNQKKAEAYADNDKVILDMYKLLDTEDKAEIRGEMKHMLKADKYNNTSISGEIAETLKNIRVSPINIE